MDVTCIPSMFLYFFQSLFWSLILIKLFGFMSLCYPTFWMINHDYIFEKNCTSWCHNCYKPPCLHILEKDSCVRKSALYIWCQIYEKEPCLKMCTINIYLMSFIKKNHAWKCALYIWCQIYKKVPCLYIIEKVSCARKCAL